MGNLPTPVLVTALHYRRPAKGRDVVFADAAGILIIGEVLGLSAQGWRIGQFHGEPRYTIRRLSGGRWRTAWRVVAVYPIAASGAFYEAVALGLYERTRQIQLAIGGKGPNADAGAGRPEQDPPAHREGKT